MFCQCMFLVIHYNTESKHDRFNYFAVCAEQMCATDLQLDINLLLLCFSH